jgi:COP9 signalosome complex subunit 4
LLNETIAISTSLLKDLALFLDVIIAESTGQVIARQVLTEYVAKITDLKEISDRELIKEVMAMSLEKIQPKVSTFEEQVSSYSFFCYMFSSAFLSENYCVDDLELILQWLQICTLRERYGDILEQDEEFPEAAKVLIGIPLESGQR